MGLRFGNPAVEFTFPGQDGVEEQDKAKVTLRGVTLQKVQEIEKTVNKKRIEYHSPRKGAPSQRFEVIDTDDQLLFSLIWDFAIVSWKNVCDETGNQLECTLENKLALLRGSLPFLSQVTTWREQLEEDLDVSNKDAEGN